MPGGKRILIIDDEADFAGIVSDCLTAFGHEVFCAGDGAAGLAACREKGPDVILLDIMMPKKDGFAVMRELRETDARSASRVIFVTALGRELTKEERAIVGNRPFIRKPFEMEALVAEIEKVG